MKAKSIFRQTTLAFAALVWNLAAWAGDSNPSQTHFDDASAEDHSYVDLGLPSGTLWATCNIGANSPEEYGDYFAWGETEPQADNSYTWETYKYAVDNYDNLTKYCYKSFYGNNGFTDNLTELELTDDAAFVNWGSNWRMPSKEQLDELVNDEYTTRENMSVNGVQVRKVTSKSNGNYILLPYAGVRDHGFLASAGTGGYYLSRTLDSRDVIAAKNMSFISSGIRSNSFRYLGQSVRPVRTMVEATCAEVNAGADGMTYRVTGRVESIVNTQYGNWYLEDETGKIYIYGTVDANGRYPKNSSWESFGISEGDIVTVQGPKTTYNGTAELVDVRVVTPMTLWTASRFTIHSDSTDIAVSFTCLGDSYDVEIPENAQSWLSVKSRTEGKENAVVLHVDENKSSSRYASVMFSSTIDGEKYQFYVGISQSPYYFTCQTEEGVEMSFRINSDGDQKTCCVSGKGEDPYAYYPAIDTLTTGHITIPAEANGYVVNTIDFYAFKNCRELTAVTIPETVSIMNNGAFAGCGNLADIHFPSVITDLGPEVFTETAWFANQPDGVVYINNLLYTYKGEMPEDTTITVKDGITSISYGAFNGRTNLTGIELPASLERIGAFAFGYSGIRQVTIPENCTNIYTRGFQGCSSLEEVTFTGKTYLGIATFSFCPNLKTITCFSTEPPSTHASSFYYRFQDGNDNSIYNRATLYVPAGSVEAYQQAAPWSEFQTIKEIDLANIRIGNIYYNLNKEDGTAEVIANPDLYSGDVVIPEQVRMGEKNYTVTGIGEKAFNSCSDLRSITLPNTLESIGSRAFYGCESLVSVSIPNSTTSIGSYAFAGCSVLESITLPANLKSIEVATFWQCTKLAYISIPTSVETIGIGAFQACQSLRSITIHGAIKTIEQQAFMDCTALQSVTIGKNIEKVGSYAFYSCGNRMVVNFLRTEPFAIAENVFPIGNYTGLNVPLGTKERYENTDGWSQFPYITEGTFNNVDINGLNFTLSSEEHAAMLQGEYVKHKGELQIPSKVEFDEEVYDVKEIMFWAIRNNTELTSLIIPETVTTIGRGAFSGCTNLESISIPESISFIDDGAFEGTAWYNNLPDGLIYIGKMAFAYKGEMPANTQIEIKNGTTALRAGLFRGFANLTAIRLPEGITAIASNTFRDCTGLTEISLPSSVTAVEDYAFAGCTGMTSCSLPPALCSIGESAFRNCVGLESIEIPESVTEIGRYAFSNCLGLTSIHIPGSVSEISDGMLIGCRNLTSLTFPEGITSIGAEAFATCRGLVTLSLPQTLTKIGDGALEGCENLRSIIIPAGVTSIGAPVFYQCHSLSTVVVEEGNTVYDSREGCNAIIEKATNTLVAGCKETVIPSSVTTIGKWAFWHNYSIESLVIPESVTSIGELAFGSCRSLANVVVPNSVREMGMGVFQACAFSSIQIPAALTSIEKLSFSHCSHLKEVIIPEGVKTIGEEAFEKCDSLVSVTIGSHVDSIASEAFGQCSSLRKIILLGRDPSALGDDVFTCIDAESGDVLSLYDLATLYVPAGTKEVYEQTDEWNKFQNIVEMDVEPLQEGEKVDFAENGEMNEETNLDGTIVGNIYFNISNENGSYSPDEGCIVITESTSDEEMEGIADKDFFDKDLKETFTGIIFKVPAGSGNVKITAETTGNMTMKVKIGSDAPIEMELEGKLKVKFPYNVGEETLVYIYAGESASARGRRFAESDKGSLKIYGIECETIPDAITSARTSTPSETVIHDLGGQRIAVPEKGIAIVNGQKVIVR